MKKIDWKLPRDGDIILTDDSFIFYVMGYDHPDDRVISYLKYIPINLKNDFNLEWIPHKWQLSELEYVRPKDLYTPKNFASIEVTFKNKFPDYLFHSKNIGKTVFAIPYQKIKRVFIPKDGLQELVKVEKKDPLQSHAINLINVLSEHSKVPLQNFGIHGSLLTAMHSDASDIDVAVYGKENHDRVKVAVEELEKQGRLKYLFEIPTDKIRKNKGLFEGQKFVFNAIREVSEVNNVYHAHAYHPIKQIRFKCKVVDDSQSMFRPAVYMIENFEAFNESSKLENEQIPSSIVSMIGEFRDVVHDGEWAKVSGMLEEVRNLKTEKVTYRVVIGSGIGKEFILPLDFS